MKRQGDKRNYLEKGKREAGKEEEKGIIVKKSGKRRETGERENFRREEKEIEREERVIIEKGKKTMERRGRRINEEGIQREGNKKRERETRIRETHLCSLRSLIVNVVRLP